MVAKRHDDAASKPHDRAARTSEEIPEIPRGWKPRARNAVEIDAIVERLPLEPGVYIMRDRKGRIVYVGKARKLRNRVRQYFNGHDDRFFVPLLGRVVGDIETVVTENDKEALLLENTLIKRHRPRFNVKLRDDKQYLVLKLDPRRAWPRMEVVRNIQHDAAHYFGPFHSASRARQTLRVVNRHFKLRTCTDHVLKTRTRPCLQYQIDRCPAPCVFEVSEDEYDEQVQDVALFLSGRHDELTAGLRKRMKAAADLLEFETAARVRDQLRAVETTLQAQQVVASGKLDQDVVGMYREGGQVQLVVLHVRAGKLVGTEDFSQRGLELPDGEVMGGFLSAYYDAAPFAPDEILLSHDAADDDLEPLRDALTERRGKKVVIKRPARGDRRKLVELASRNASSAFVTRRDREGDQAAALAQLQKRLGLSRAPHRIECYDISHIQGSDTVASMVVFHDGRPEKSAYRSFKIKGQVDGGGLAQGTRHNDDFASMYEVLTRRFRRALDDEGWDLPDLIVIDGGKGQLGRVLASMQDMGIPLGVEGVDVISLAKEREGELGYDAAALETLRAEGEADPATEPTPGAALQEHVVRQVRAQDAAARTKTGRKARTESFRPERVFIPDAKDPIRLRPGSSELYLLTRVRDEAHRFAITHHRNRRAKRQVKSVLDDIPGVGPALKRALVKHFGGVRRIRDATVEQLTEVPGVGQKTAVKIHAAIARGG